MRVRVLGSAAAEAVPALWCECETCAEAKRDGGKDIRRRCSYLVDDDTLVDFGPDIFSQTVSFGVDLPRLERLLITHSHEDHLSPVDLLWRMRGFSQVSRQLKVYADRGALARIERETKQSFAALSLEPVELVPGRRVVDGGLEIIPLAAQHGPEGEQALNYVLRRGGAGILIANDTGWWPEETWAAVSGLGLRAAVVECTMGVSPKSIDHQAHHLGANVSLRFRDELLRLGAITPDALVVVNHFSHNGHCLQARLEDFFAPHGIEVAYDGMDLDIPPG